MDSPVGQRFRSRVEEYLHSPLSLSLIIFSSIVVFPRSPSVGFFSDRGSLQRSLQLHVSAPMQKVAIFGGTFNPVHWGHLLIAEMAVSQFGLDQVFWVPTGRPPYKRQGLTEFEHRLEMVRRAIADNPIFTASNVDAHRPGHSYAIDTFQDLKALHSERQWHWIIGQDAFQSLPNWRGLEVLAAGCTWLVAPRREDSSAGATRRSAVLSPLPEQCCSHRLEMPAIEISSSLIRHRCEQEQSIRYLVPDSVRHYIQAHRLFQAVPKSENQHAVS